MAGVSLLTSSFMPSFCIFLRRTPIPMRLVMVTPQFLSLEARYSRRSSGEIAGENGRKMS
jgi:hypothetical protein